MDLEDLAYKSTWLARAAFALTGCQTIKTELARIQAVAEQVGEKATKEQLLKMADRLHECMQRLVAQSVEAKTTLVRSDRETNVPLGLLDIEDLVDSLAIDQTWLSGCIERSYFGSSDSRVKVTAAAAAVAATACSTFGCRVHGRKWPCFV